MVHSGKLCLLFMREMNDLSIRFTKSLGDRGEAAPNVHIEIIFLSLKPINTLL